MKRYDFESFEEFFNGKVGLGYEMAMVFHGDWVRALLCTECKSWETALIRFFKAVPEFKDLHGRMIKAIDNGCWSASSDGYKWEVGCIDDGLWSVYVSKNQADCSSEQPANEEESAESVAEASEEEKDEGEKMGNAIVLKSNAAKNLERLIDIAECSQSLEFYYGVINASQKDGNLLYGERESLIERLAVNG